MIFCRGSRKVREFCVAEVSQDLSLISRHIFVRHDPYRHFFPHSAGIFLSSLRSDFYQIRVVKSGKIALKSQGILFELVVETLMFIISHFDQHLKNKQ